MRRHPDGPRIRINPQEQSKPGAAKMTTFLGKFGPVRLVLWLAAAGLCFVVWPKLALWPKDSLISYASSKPVVLYYDEDRKLTAWDYQANKQWSVAGLTARPQLSFCPAGAHAIAMMEPPERIRVVDIAPPHQSREYRLSGDESFTDLYLVTADERFAVLREASRKNSPFLVVVDLSTGHAVDRWDSTLPPPVPGHLDVPRYGPAQRVWISHFQHHESKRSPAPKVPPRQRLRLAHRDRHFFRLFPTAPHALAVARSSDAL